MDAAIDQVRALARAHGLDARVVVEIAPTGTVNRVFLLDRRLVLRLPHDQPRALASTRCEMVAAPIGIAAGVLTPRLLVADASCSLTSVPFTIYERAPGVVASACGFDVAAERGFWREVGAQMALLHERVRACEDPLGHLERPSREDPRGLPEALHRDHYISAEQARWVDAWIARLQPAIARAPEPPRFLHADLHPANLMIDAETRALTGILDWGDAGFGDPSLELRCVPLRAVPATLEGYTQDGGALDPVTIGGRVLWDHLVLVLERLRNPPRDVPQRWLSEPATAMFELARFLRSDAGEPFRAWLPPP